MEATDLGAARRHQLTPNPPQNQDTHHLQDRICRCLPDEATLSGPVFGEGQIRAFKTSRWVREGLPEKLTARLQQGRAQERTQL